MAIDTSPSQLQQPGPQTLGSNVVSFLGLMLRAQEAKAEAPGREAATRLTVARAAGLEQENTLMATVSKKFPELMKEWGETKGAVGQYEFIGRNAQFAVTPQGSAILGKLLSVANKTAEFEQESMAGMVKQAEAKRAADQYVRYGFTGPEATKRDEITALEKEVAALGGNPASLTYDDSLFNEQGYFLSPGTRQRLKSMAEPSLNLQQREEEGLIRLQIAEDRLGLLQAQAENKSFVPSEAGKRVQELEAKRGPLTKDELDIAYGLQPRPGTTRDITRTQYINRHINAWMGSNEGQGRTRQDAIKALGKEFDKHFAGPATMVEDNYDRFKAWLEKKK